MRKTWMFDGGSCDRTNSVSLGVVGSTGRLASRGVEMSENYGLRQALRDLGWITAPCAALGVFSYAQGYKKTGLSLLAAAGALVILGVLAIASRAFVSLSAHIARFLRSRKGAGNTSRARPSPSNMRFTREICQSIGRQLRDARLANRHTQQQLALVLRVSRQTVIRYERGELAPTGEVLARVVSYVGALELGACERKLTSEALEPSKPLPDPPHSSSGCC
jgi:DNA-binding XRE family transcriptional regulator